MSNTMKMAAGIPLDDSDRWPWLALTGRALATDPSPVIACSALRRRYRDVLRDAAPRTVFLELDLPREALRLRLAARTHEFMSPDLLDSQLATLEPVRPDESGARLDGTTPLGELVEAALASVLVVAATGAEGASGG